MFIKEPTSIFQNWQNTKLNVYSGEYQWISQCLLKSSLAGQKSQWMVLQKGFPWCVHLKSGNGMCSFFLHAKFNLSVCNKDSERVEISIEKVWWFFFPQNVIANHYKIASITILFYTGSEGWQYVEKATYINRAVKN